MTSKEMCFVNDSGYSYLSALIEGNMVTIRQSRIENDFSVQVGDLTLQEFILKLSNEGWQDVEEVEVECKILAGEGIYF